MVTAVDLVRGLGVLTGMDTPSVEGANAWYDTNYEGKRDAAIAGLRVGSRPVRDPRRGDRRGRSRRQRRGEGQGARELGPRILADLVPALDEMGPWRLLMMPDHATPLGSQDAHGRPRAVPAGRLVGSTGPAGSTTEAGVADAAVVAGHELMGRLVAGVSSPTRG
jgi:2,3-bisphosphoglycerate-independent phosphoglycerate mutase